MITPPNVMEIFLQPGELWFGGRDNRIRTILGSCVALVLWHPKRHIGGMCHYLLPHRGSKGTSPLDGRYADEAIDLLLAEIRKADTRPQEYEAKLFGGGRMFHHPYCDGQKCSGQVQDRNVRIGRELVSRHGFHLKAEHLGGHGHRQVIFDIWSGHAWMKHTPLPTHAQCPMARVAR